MTPERPRGGVLKRNSADEEMAAMKYKCAAQLHESVLSFWSSSVRAVKASHVNQCVSSKDVTLTDFQQEACVQSFSTLCFLGCRVRKLHLVIAHNKTTCDRPGWGGVLGGGIKKEMGGGGVVVFRCLGLLYVREGQDGLHPLLQTFFFFFACDTHKLPPITLLCCHTLVVYPDWRENCH